MPETPPQDLPRNAEEARERARLAVQAAYAEPNLEAPPERRCPSCGITSATWSSRCPACDKRFDRRFPWLTDGMRIALAIVALVAAGGALAVVAPRITESKSERAAKDEEARTARIARERARLVREQRVVRVQADEGLRDRGPAAEIPERLENRRALVALLQDSILAEARKREATGELKGTKVKEVRCDPLVRNAGNARDEELMAKRVGRYDCVAVQREVVRTGKVLGYFGHPFVGAVRFRTGEITFCKDNKAPSERGEALAEVVVPPACIGAEGAKRLGNGYVDPDSPVPTPPTVPEL